MVVCQAAAPRAAGQRASTILEFLRGSAAGLLSGHRDRGARPASSSVRWRCTSMIIQRRTPVLPGDLAHGAPIDRRGHDNRLRHAHHSSSSHDVNDVPRQV